MRHDRPLLFKILLALCLTLFLASCFQSKVTKENYEKIQNGMTVEEVKKILGEPTQSEMKEASLPFLGKISGTQATWKNPDAAITITILFANDKVQLKTFDGK